MKVFEKEIETRDISEITRAEIVEAARSFRRVSYREQGRSRDGLDCGGFILLVGQIVRVTALEVLGYSNAPDAVSFEKLLNENLELLGPWRQCSLLPADILSADEGFGIQHVLMITGSYRSTYTVIDCTRNHGVAEYPLRYPITNKIRNAYRIKGICS